MIIFLYGPDGYRLKENLNQIVDSYKKKHSSGVNLFYLNLEESSDQSKLSDALKSNSFFNEVKLIVCRNAFSSKQVSQAIVSLADRYGIIKAKETVLLIAENYQEKELSSKSKELFKVASNSGNLVRSFDFLNDSKLDNWIKAEFALRGCSIDAQTTKKLVFLAGNESWSLVNEIDKISNYKKSGKITLADVDALVGTRADMNIFDLIDAIGARNKTKAFELLYKEIKTGRDPYYILTMITYQFRNLIMIKDLSDRGMSQAEIVNKSGLHPFVVRKMLNNVGRFSSEEIKKTYSHINAYDKNFKSGTINLEDSLYALVT